MAFNSSHTRCQVEGVHDKTDATEIQMLLEGKLFINIATRLKPSNALRGQILLVPTFKRGKSLLSLFATYVIAPINLYVKATIEYRAVF